MKDGRQRQTPSAPTEAQGGAGSAGDDAGRASLPPALDRCVQDVVEATGLDLRERGEIAIELRDHFEDGLASGRTEEELLRRFGDPVAVAREIRRARRTGGAATRARFERRWRMGWGDISRELTGSIRTLVREPGYAIVVILTLALGVGANTAVFTVLDSVLIQPLPYPGSEELVRIYDVWHEEPDELNEYLRSPAIRAYQEWDEAFAGVAAMYTYRETGVDLTDGDIPERVVASHVSAGYFETLGVEPALGRTFRPEESSGPGLQTESRIGAPVAVLSARLWQSRFDGDPGVLDRRVELDGDRYTIVGVMPPGFENPLGSMADLWVPTDLRPGENLANDWSNHYLTGIARLAHGLTLEAAQARVDALNQRMNEAEPDNEGWLVELRPLQEDIVGGERKAILWLLAGAVGLVLISACVNVANLVFARGLGRDRDLALRGALGSGRGRILAHLLSETAVLAVLGGTAGLLVGAWGIQFLLSLAPDALPSVADPGLSLRIFGFAFLCTGLALLLFGVAPALRLSRTPAADILRAGGRGGTDTRGLKRLRSGLVVAQVSVAVVLVAGAGLLLRSFQALQDVELGIDDAGVLTFEVHLPTARYPDGPSRDRFHQAFHAQVSRIPAVESVGAVSWLPVDGRYHWWSVATQPGWDGEAEPDEVAWIDSDIRVVAGDYFEATGIEVLRGRSPSEVDLAGPPVAWLNQRGSETIFPETDPLDQFVYVAGTTRRVVGVVEDTPYDTRGQVSRKTYMPHEQFNNDRNWALIQTVKTRSQGTEVLEELRSALDALDPALVLYRPRPLSSLLAAARTQERFATLLMTVFAALALILAAVGSYGVMAGNVTRQRREIGIRLALGAEPSRVRSMVLGRAFRLSVAGAALGLAVAWLGSRWIESLLFQVEATDPVVFLGGGLLLVLLGLLSGWLPARTATRVQPAETLDA